MNQLVRNRVILWTTGALTTIVSLGLLWSYILSFQEVTFRYDDTLGYIELIDEHNEKIYPKHNQPIQIAEGEYHIQHVGTYIRPEYRTLTITNDTTVLDISYNYTEKHLDSLLEKVQSDVHTVLYSAYPNAKNNYQLTHEKLYRLGDIYGVALVARTPDDNSDTLRVLLEKKNDTWHILSKPPTPILSSPDYPDIDSAILRDINQAK